MTDPIGIVGAGQLARMLGEAASALGLRTVVLAEHPTDAAVGIATDVVPGGPTVEADLRALAERAPILTFDHEQVDLDVLARVEASGTIIRPGLRTLQMATDKLEMRTRLAAAGVPGPAFAALAADDPVGAVRKFADDHGWPVVVKAARGGYDGKGVWPVSGPDEARPRSAGRPAARCSSRSSCRSTSSWPSSSPAAPAARRSRGRRSRRPRSTASAGRCSCPAGSTARSPTPRSAIGRRVADVAGAVGVLADRAVLAPAASCS